MRSLVAAAALCVAWAQTPPGDGSGKPGKLDLRLKMPRATASIEGTWEYRPLDGSAPYVLTIGRTQKGFYEYEGRRGGAQMPVLQMDRGSEQAMVYRGEIGEGFDPCIPAGARFTLSPTVDALVFEPSMPVLAPVGTPPPGPCAEARTYVLAAKGHGDLIRLKPPMDLVGGPQPPNVQQPPDGRLPSQSNSSQSDRKPAGTVSLGAPMAPDGTKVALLGSLKDLNDHLWHHVRLLEPLPSAAPEDDRAAQGGTNPREPNGRGSSSKSSASATKGSSAASSAPPRPEEPPSGYVAAENLVVRWECRLVHAPGAGAPAGAGDAPDSPGGKPR